MTTPPPPDTQNVVRCRKCSCRWVTQSSKARGDTWLDALPATGTDCPRRGCSGELALSYSLALTGSHKQRLAPYPLLPGATPYIAPPTGSPQTPPNASEPKGNKGHPESIGGPQGAAQSPTGSNPYVGVRGYRPRETIVSIPSTLGRSAVVVTSRALPALEIAGAAVSSVGEGVGEGGICTVFEHTLDTRLPLKIPTISDYNKPTADCLVALLPANCAVIMPIRRGPIEVELITFADIKKTSVIARNYRTPPTEDIKQTTTQAHPSAAVVGSTARKSAGSLWKLLLKSK